MSKKLKSRDIVVLDYYQRPFHLLHQQVSNTRRNFADPHEIRKRFWSLIPCGEYSPEQGRVFLNSYLFSVEAEIAEIVSKLSIAYSLHLYRRLSPGHIGLQRQPRTIGLTRAVLEAAIQKYARFRLCGKIADSSTIPIERILGGLLMAPEFEIERTSITQGSQFVLSDFTVVDLLNFYDLERLAYEVWRTSAALRTTGKGAPLEVLDPPECFADNRSPELNFLVSHYDQRLDMSDMSHSGSGVVFSDTDAVSASGYVVLPMYNLEGISGKNYDQVFAKLYKSKISPDCVFNFVWTPFSLREYREAHAPFATAFYKLYEASFDAVLAVVAALSIRVLSIWELIGIGAFTNFHQRAYEGPCHKKFIRNEICAFIPLGCKVIGIDESKLTSDDIDKAISFWELDVSKQKIIDLSYSGPHCIFLPVSDDLFFIDYAWIFRRLHDLFVGVRIDNQNFKGDALENAVRKGSSMLPVGPCVSNEGDKRQIDYAAEFGSSLLIAECKAVGMSIGFDRGDPKAIAYRTTQVVERSLSEIDEKANWLASHKIGKNYDIAKYDYIIPVGVSPFVEFIPSKHQRYWVAEGIPRVLLPKELEQLLQHERDITTILNKVSIH